MFIAPSRLFEPRVQARTLRVYPEWWEATNSLRTGVCNSEEKILYFDDLLTTAKAHPSVFPSAHMHQAAVIAFNKGDLHLHWERPKQAEQWIGMAVKIATASRGVPAESKDKMQEAYTSCLEALRA